jgi:hypothetical protein
MLLCEELPPETVAALNAKLQTLPADHPLRKESCVVSKDGNCAIFRSSGFYFRRIRHNLESEIVADMREGREYLCSVFEVDQDDPSVVQQLRDRFQEQHGHMAAMIDDHVLTVDGKQLMLVKFPSCVVRDMLEPSGGLLKTGYRGSKASLMQIPTLVRFGQIPEDGNYSMFVTEYKEHQYYAAKRIHYDILREVISRPNLGITLNPIALWDS